MTTYYVIAKTQDSKVHEAVQDVLNGVDGELKIELHEQPDDPGAEAGSYLLWYHSESHNKIRYYVAPPPGPFTKPIWSYEKKDAAKLSKAACEIVQERMQKMGYETKLELEATVKLGIVEGGKKDEPEEEAGPFKADNPIEAFMRFYDQTEEKVQECIGKMEDAGFLDGAIDYEIKTLVESVNPIVKGKDNWQVNITFGSPQECEEWKGNEESQKLYMEYATTVSGAKLQVQNYGDAVFKPGKVASVTNIMDKFDEAVEDLKEAVSDEKSISPHTAESVQEIADAVKETLGEVEFAPGDGLTDDEANAMPTGKNTEDKS